MAFGLIGPEQGGVAKYAADIECRRETVAESLKRQLVQSRDRQAKIERFLNLLERNPEFQELLDLSRELY